jgi:hypothetical protein
MLVEELLEQLEQMDKDAEVRFASQPSYPMEYTLDSVVQVDPTELTEHLRDEINQMVNSSVEAGELTHSEADTEVTRLMHEARENNINVLVGEPQMVVYLGEGRQIGYLNAKASEELGWS